MSVVRGKAYVQLFVVKAIDELHQRVYDKGVGKDATSKVVSDGWVVKFKDTTTTIRMRTEPADIKVGDTMRATWEIMT